MDMDEAVKTVSPVHNINKMPDIPYFIAHCKEDTDVPIKEHSDIMVKLMREHGFDITYIEVPDRGHVNLDEDTFNKFIEFIKRNIAENRNN